MFSSYLLVAWRNLLRNKVLSIINICGLAIGIASAFLIYLYNASEHSYDRTILSGDRIFRVPISYYKNGSLPERASVENAPAVGPAMNAAFPEIESYARLMSTTTSVQSTVVSGISKGKQFSFSEDHVYFADPTLITLFNFQMVEGHAATSLLNPHSIVLTESIAKKYFGDKSPMGQTLRVNNEDYKVTGVVHDLPINTHLDSQILLSFSYKDFAAQDWTWPRFYTYVKVIDGTDLQLLQSKFKALVDANVPKTDNNSLRMAIDLQPITDIHLNSHFGREMKDNGDAKQLYFVCLLGILILVTAWINYINLSTAKAIERAKEVGLRKVVGAARFQLVSQFLFDALLVNVGASIIALVLITAALPSFELLTGIPITSIVTQSNIIGSFSFWIVPTLVFVIGVLAVGFYPALVLSSFKPAVVLKGKFMRSGSGIFLRKLLVGFQYVLSILLIGGTITVSMQIDFMQSQDLGYNQELLIVKGPNNVDSTLVSRFNEFKYDMSQIPGIINMGRTGDIPGGNMVFMNMIRLLGQDVSENVMTYVTGVDDQFLDTYEIPLVAGRQIIDKDRFSFPNYPSIATLIPPRDRTWHPERNKIIINERLSQLLGFKTPEDAINQKVKVHMWDEFTGEIIGVVKNYHQRSLRDSYEPLYFYYGAFDSWPFISIKLKSRDIAGTIDKIRDSYSKAFPGNPFEYSFLDKVFNRQYKGEQKFRQVISLLTGLAMVIACLGLIGLGLYSVSQRIKEIGIRKVLGAPVSSILILFCGDSAKIVAWSSVVALPVLIWGATSWLSNFAFHVDLNWMMFLIPSTIGN